MGEENMDEKTSIILRDLLLEALEDYREDDPDTELYYHMGKLMKKTKEGFLNIELENDMNKKSNILFRDMILQAIERFRGDDPNSDEYYNLSRFIEKIKNGSIDL